MKKWNVIASAGAAALALSVVGLAQSSSSSQSSSQSATPSTSSGSTGGQSTQGTQSSPGMRTTPMAGGMTGHAPTGNGPSVASDCSNNGWQNYPDQKFKDQKACEKWVKKNASTKGSTGATDSHSMSHTPRSGSTSPNSGTSDTQQMQPTPRPPQR
jgi:hypothetical protein